MEKALLVTIKLKSEHDNWGLEDIAEEMEELALTAGAEPIDNITCICERPTPDLFIGKGKAQELALIAQEEDINTVILSRDLSGTQQRNLEEVIGKKVIDRTQLILDIFARHAKSSVGKTQVELAQLEYLFPRLVGKGIILSRLGGGIGTRGPGEQKLEVDRRRIRKRIDRLKKDLKHAALHSKVIQEKRSENSVPTVALIGYTNAGKSTLLNKLTGSSQVVSNSLFTTLDTVYKNFFLPEGENIFICDTVGFINNLPHHLVEAFKSTLKETAQADLLIHVLDASHPRVYERNKAVMAVLESLDAQDRQMITALNKIDLLDDKTWLKQLGCDFVNPIAISAVSGENIQELLENITKTFQGRMIVSKVRIPNYRMDIVDLIYREGRIEEIEYNDKAIVAKIRLPKILYNKLLQKKEIERVY